MRFPVQASAMSIRAKHPDRIPVIVEKKSGDMSLPDIDKKKFLVPATPVPHAQNASRTDDAFVCA